LYKVIEWEIHFLILYMWMTSYFASSDVNILHEKKKFLSSSFNENDLDKASFVLRIETYRNRWKRVLEILQMHK
jgi:hypothetical protein